MANRTYKQMMQQLGRDDVTVTFGIAQYGDADIVQVKPRSVYYGEVYGYGRGVPPRSSRPESGASAPEDEREESVLTRAPIPLIYFEFNKFRPDLPDWDAVREFVLASQVDTAVHEYTFIDAGHRNTYTTGDVKTVEMHGEGPTDGVDGAIIQRDEVAQHRDMDRTTDVSDGSAYKVNDELY